MNSQKLQSKPKQYSTILRVPILIKKITGTFQVQIATFRMYLKLIVIMATIYVVCMSVVRRMHAHIYYLTHMRITVYIDSDFDITSVSTGLKIGPHRVR